MTTSDYTAIYDPDTDFDAVYTRATARRIVAQIQPGDRVLEAGCAAGLMTAALAAAGASVVAVDRSPEYLVRLRDQSLPGVRTVRADLDTEALPAGPFDHVVATNLLHELVDPASFLERAAASLATDGLIHVSVPNPASLHRLIALEMGWISDLEAISDRGQRFSTRRLLGQDAVGALAAGAGLALLRRTGVFCKPLPNAMLAELPAEVIEGLDRVSDRVPDLCAMSLYTLSHAER